MTDDILENPIIARRMAWIREEIENRGLRLRHGDRLDETDTAKLLEVCKQTLKDWAIRLKKIQFKEYGVNRRFYKLVDIAAYMEGIHNISENE